MEKILLVLDATGSSTALLDFSCYIAELTKSSITGVFLEDMLNEERSFVAEEQPSLSPVIHSFSQEYIAKQKIVDENIARFAEACERRSLRFAIHRDRGLPLEEIIEESRFADLLIVSPHLSFEGEAETAPSHFLKEILKSAECPVIIAPESFEGVEEVVFTYDGSKSSVFSIKQFAYLFPSLKNCKATVLWANEEGQWPEKEKYHLKEWLRNHYVSFSFEMPKGRADAELMSYLLKKDKALVVMGAYGRSALSRFFHNSQADIIIKTMVQPIFITHY